MAPPIPSSAPADVASSVSGRTPTTTSTRSAKAVSSDAGRFHRIDLEAAGRTPGRPGDPLDRRVGPYVDAVRGQLGVHERSEARVDGGKHLGELLELGDRQSTGGQPLGHLETDVAGTHDHGAGGLGLLERAHQLEGVTHGVQQVHTIGWH